jgi:hypothetical protein
MNEQEQEQERHQRAQEVGARLAASLNLSAGARKGIVSAAVGLAILLAILAAWSLSSTSPTAASSGLPNRLSCGAELPTVWENGEMIFDFAGSTPTVTLTGARQRIIVGKVSGNGSEKVFTATGVLNVATGSVTAIAAEGGYTLRPLGKTSKTAHKVRLTINPGIGSVDMQCMSQT